MQLLLELNQTDIDILTENVNGKKSYYIEGKFLSGDTKNRNGRVYPKSVLEGAVNKFREDYINQNRSVGELNHSPGFTVNLDKVSHIIESLTFHGADVYGKARVIDTPNGKILKTLIDENYKPGVSSRGMGKVNKARGNMVEEFLMSTVDVVSDPSGFDCYVKGLSESIEWKFVDGEWMPVDLQESFDQITKKEKNLIILERFERLLSNIK